MPPEPMLMRLPELGMEARFITMSPRVEDFESGAVGAATASPTLPSRRTKSIAEPAETFSILGITGGGRPLPLEGVVVRHRRPPTYGGRQPRHLFILPPPPRLFASPPRCRSARRLASGCQEEPQTCLEQAGTGPAGRDPPAAAPTSRADYSERVEPVDSSGSRARSSTSGAVESKDAA